MSAEALGQPEETGPVKRKRRRRARSALYAVGEPMIWLTGGGLVLCTLMILGLLALIFAYGLGTFWPGDVVKFTTHDGEVYMGEVTRKNDFIPEPTLLASLTPEARKRAEAEMEANEGKLHRRLVRTGNFRITQNHFSWVSNYNIKEEEHPEWAILLERHEWGRFYGFPDAFVFIKHYIEPEFPADKAKKAARKYAEEIGERARLVVKAPPDQRTALMVAPLSDLDKVNEIVGVGEFHEGAEAAWAQFNECHGGVTARYRKRRDLEKFDTGHVNHVQEAARLAVREAELELEDAEFRSGRESSDYRARAGELEEAKAHYKEISTWAAKEFARIREEIDAINKENGRYQLVMATAGEGKKEAVTTLQPVSTIVRAFPPNQLSTTDKLGVYASRWVEYVFDEPREANSEGGVWPAIFGTVIMALLMSIAVVPFGVLAALYIREYAKPGPVVSAVRIAINNLAGVPSIVFGVFGLGFFCYIVGGYLDGGPKGIDVKPMAPPIWWILLFVVVVTGTAAFFSWLVSMRKNKEFDNASRNLAKILSRCAVGLWLLCFAVAVYMIVKIPFYSGFFRASLPNPTYGKGGLIWASLTLALLTLPVVIVATEEALAAVPSSMREGAYGCGASKWQTIQTIVLPRALPGIMTGAILAMARGAGEVAPLMLVGAVKLAPHLPVDSIFPYVHPERSFMHLGFHIYDVGFQSQNSEAAKPMVYTTTLLLILIIAVLNLAAIYLRARLRRKFVVGQF